MTDFIDQAAKADFEGLKEFITTLENRSRKRGSNRTRAENHALDGLIKTFREGAILYFNGAKKIIQETEVDPKKRSHAYRQILGPLIEHARLLSDIARPYLDQDEKKFANTQKIEKIIETIATRLDNFFFFPISSQNFQYIHFNYMANIGVIGIPPQILGVLSWNSSVFWHEVAGHAIAAARRRGLLTRWAAELADDLQKQKLLLAYQALYEKSNEAGPDNDEWQADWLGEFFEDLFGIQVVGGAMVEILAEVLVRRRRDLNRGDASHPPPNLRLQVALEFLSDDSDDTEADQQILDRLLGRYGSDLLDLTEALKNVADVIATFYRQKVQDGEFSRQEPDIGVIEKKLAANFRDFVRQFSETEESQPSQSLWQFLEASNPKLFQEGEAFEPDTSLPALGPSTLWTSVKNDADEDVAIFFLKDVEAVVKVNLENIVPILEKVINDPDTQSRKVIQDYNEKYTAAIDIDGREIVVTYPKSSKHIAIIVVKDVEGRELFVNDLDSLLEVQFAEEDECCGLLIGPGR